ncbi:hypothetical protein H2202_003001 [Exophiala xenobiotica]|nr:hypothetical protein H2202_003001 [Exophiala xenobiotica]KAK5199944.1 hypothetical protein LTR92_000485 [Exophiala xenobiotica]KAK5224565.1 hypothetical protein LTR72_004346 [Exophiala xenobiotica]KAK5293648.1 hypothetical protein LTR14_004539 [Exophiala xenobiotica]KAK5332025.1 hypothetical protein LTR93_001030 [Exophiala xenobiotica]
MASKPTSRWNFLQQAVASVESRLDDILAEGSEPPKRVSTPVQVPRDSAPSRPNSSDLSRSNSNASNANDRLQERLARAMAKKNASRTDSPTPGFQPAADVISNESAPELDTEVKEEPVTDAQHTDTSVDGQGQEPETEQARQSPKPAEDEPTLATLDDIPESDQQVPKIDISVQNEASSTRTSTDALRVSQPLSARASQDLPRKSEESLAQMVGTSELREEISIYIEKIDALQSKLQYLSKEAARSATQAAASAQPGSLEKKILEKDEKIALLMEEGQKLSKTEMKHLNTIKKMRAQMNATYKEQEAAKLRADKAERVMKDMEDRAKKAEAASKRAEQSLAAITTGSSDLEAVRKERDALQTTLADMRSQISKANARAEAAESKAQADQVAKEAKRNAELQDDLTSAKVEREISEEKLRREIKDLQATLEREKEQTKAMESEMLGEQAALESKLEYFRVRAEEASSADHGHVQAKLLRQVETLQSQYATASQNWQGIESTLLGRITNLEKERDEIAAREADLRKKLRDATLKLKSTEKELNGVQNGYADVERSLAVAEGEAQRLNRKAAQLEADIANALQELEEQKAASERELQRKLEEEKAKWTATLQIQRTESPGTSIRKASNLALDIGHLMSPVQYDRPTSRKPSMMQAFDWNTPPRHQSAASFRAMANGSIAETPSVVASNDADDFFANIPPTPHSISQHSHRGVNDLISTSTVGAGPSVQLVERMSANVRRLESEKAATKDELARLATQRDEARQEVVNLMREVEEKRKIDDRLRALEKDHEGLSQRHRTTLELLGEKSEQVEELKADILDVKQMYRQLADTMGKS